MNYADPFSSRFEVFGREHNHRIESFNREVIEANCWIPDAAEMVESLSCKLPVQVMVRLPSSNLLPESLERITSLFGCALQVGELPMPPMSLNMFSRRSARSFRDQQP